MDSSEKKTDINQLENIEESNKIIDTSILDESKIREKIFDWSIEGIYRIKYFSDYYDKYGLEGTLEIINRFSGMYQFSGSNNIKNFLVLICKLNIPSILKLECAKSLIFFTEKSEVIDDDDDEEFKEIKKESNEQVIIRNKKRLDIGYENLDKVCSNFEEIPTPCKVDALLLLAESREHKEKCLVYFYSLVNDYGIDIKYRYKIMLSLENNNIPSKFEFVRKIFLSFLYEINNTVMYKILASQYLLQNQEKLDLDKDTIENIQIILLSISQDDDFNHNIRADAADTLLSLGSEENKAIARDIIILLGRTINSNSISVFDNSQNVHTKEIEDSLKETLKFLVELPVLKVDGIPINYKWVHNKMISLFDIKETEYCVYEDNCPHNKCNMCNSCIYDNEFEPYETMIYTSLREEDQYIESCNIDKRKFCDDNCENMYEYIDKVNISLNRIYLDRVLYSKYNQTLLNILIKVVSFIIEHKAEKELFVRLKEELYDMSGTCSTGFASRLINTMSGYDDFNIKISFEDQIISNFIARINKRMKDIVNIRMYYEEKHRDIVWLFIKNNNILDDIKEELNKTISVEEMNIDKLIDYYLETDTEIKIKESIQDFSDNIMMEMLETNNYTNRPCFIKFFRDNMPYVKEELYQEFKDYIEDEPFDLAINKAIINYE